MDPRQVVRWFLIAASLLVVAACEEAGPHGPRDIAVHPAGSYLYVAGGTLTESVWIVDAGTHQVVGTVPVPNPHELAITPSGRLYALSGRGETVVAIDTVNHVVVDELRHEGISINGIGVNGTGTLLYLATPESVLVYDTTSHKLIGSIPDGAFDVVSAPWLDEVYVLDSIYPILIAILRDADEIGEIQIPIEGGGALAVHPSGTQLYVAGTSDARILVVDPVRRAVASVIPLPHGVQALVVHPAGRIVYTVSSSEATVDAVALPGGRVLTSKSVGSSPGEIAVHPSGTHLYVTDRIAQAVYVLDASTLNITDIVQP